MENLQRVHLYPGNSAFAIQLDSGLSVHVEPGNGATLVFQNGDKPIISVKERTSSSWLKPVIALGALGLTAWYFLKE